MFESLLNTIILRIDSNGDQFCLQGFLKRCREYNKLFDDEQIDLIFSNIEQVYALQRDFLQELEARIKPDHMEESEIGEVFVLNVRPQCQANHSPYICMTTIFLSNMSSRSIPSTVITTHMLLVR